MTLHPLPVQQEEAYITRRQLAELMGVSERTVDRMVAAGMPSVVFSRRSRRFLASRALAWARVQPNERTAA